MMATAYVDNNKSQHIKRLSDVDQERCEMLMPIQGYENQPLVSLEQAIEPILSFVPDVKRMAFVAKQKCKNTPANNLTIDESASIILYSMEWEPQEQCLFYVLNRTLRAEQRKKLKPWFLYLKLILTALSRLPSAHRFVFRGIKCDMRKDYPVGKTVYWWGFSSCTTNVGVLQNEDFLGSSGPRTMFAIECFSGKDIQQHSNFQDETEILLLPGRQFEVVACLEQGNDLCMIQLKEIEPAFPLLQPISENTNQISDFDTTDQQSLTVSSKQQLNQDKKTTLKNLPLEASPNYPPKQEINILLLGPTGTGRTTFINVLANYLVNNTLEEAVNDKMQVLIPFAFSFQYPDTFDEKIINTGKSDEYENYDCPGETNTRKCRSFVFPIGDRLLRLIETPPVSDTRGIEQDMKNIDEIITYIARYKHLNGVCIFLKPDESRPSDLFRYCIQELLRHLPKNTIANIIFVFTNARKTYYFPGGTSRILQALFDTYESKYKVRVPFTKENTFLLDNEGIWYLALQRNGIQSDNEQTITYMKSWDHTLKEYARLMTYIISRSGHVVHDTVSLYEIQKLIGILTNEKIELSSLSQYGRNMNNLQNEEMKIEAVYKKLCKILEVNAIIPYNEGILRYIDIFIYEEKQKLDAGAQDDDVIKRLQTLHSSYENEISLLRKTLQDERCSENKTDLVNLEDIFALVSTLYDLPIRGHKIRKQVEEIKINENEIRDREVFVQLPTKAESSKLMCQLKEFFSKS